MQLHELFKEPPDDIAPHIWTKFLSNFTHLQGEQLDKFINDVRKLYKEVPHEVA